MTPTLEQLVTVRSQLAEDLQGYYMSFALMVNLAFGSEHFQIENRTNEIETNPCCPDILRLRR